MITFADFDQDIIAGKKPAMLVFTAAWCRPCGLQKPVIEKIAASFSTSMRIEIIDVDEQADLADRLQIRTLPATLLYAEGELIEHLHGYQAEDFLTSYVNHILKMCQKKTDESAKE